jgi:hypothetical protein
MLARNCHRLLVCLALIAALRAIAPTPASAQGQRKERACVESIVPNPFNPDVGSLHIVFWVPTGTKTTLEVFSIDGAMIASIVDDVRSGESEVLWDGRDRTGSLVANGVYVCRFVAGRIRTAQNIVVMR